MEGVLELDLSKLEDGVYFLCPHCGKPSKFVEASGYGYVSFRTKLELFGDNTKDATMDFFDFVSMEDSVDYPRILRYFCPNCGKEICDASDDGLFELKNEKVSQYLIVVKNGKIVDVGKYWKEKLGLRTLLLFLFPLLRKIF